MRQAEILYVEKYSESIWVDLQSPHGGGRYCSWWRQRSGRKCLVIVRNHIGVEEHESNSNDAGQKQEKATVGDGVQTEQKPTPTTITRRTCEIKHRSISMETCAQTQILAPSLRSDQRCLSSEAAGRRHAQQH